MEWDLDQKLQTHEEKQFWGMTTTTANSDPTEILLTSASFLPSCADQRIRGTSKSLVNDIRRPRSAEKSCSDSDRDLKTFQI
jgi:hypothetical protein